MTVWKTKRIGTGYLTLWVPSLRFQQDYLTALTLSPLSQGLFHPIDPSKESQINLILAGRAKSLEQIPFTFETFSRLKKLFLIHETIFRAVNRRTSSTFTKFSHDWDLRDERNTEPSISQCSLYTFTNQVHYLC